MELRYGILCDHADVTRTGKPIAVGIFERFRTPLEKGPIVLPSFWIASHFECSTAEGTQHEGQDILGVFANLAAAKHATPDVTWYLDRKCADGGSRARRASRYISAFG